MQFEHSTVIAADASKIFEVYAAVGQWPIWDKEVESASIAGGFHLGSKGKIKPKSAPESAIKITQLTGNQSFTIECKLPLCKMEFVHLLNPAGPSATQVVNQLKFSGFLAPVFGRLIGKGISKTMPSTLAGLKAHLESK